MKISRQYILLISILVAGFIPLAVIGSEDNTSQHSQPDNQQDSISQQMAVTIAQQQVGGRVLAIRRDKNSYRVKILSNQGAVHNIVINAFDGAVMSSR